MQHSPALSGDTSGRRGPLFAAARAGCAATLLPTCAAMTRQPSPDAHRLSLCGHPACRKQLVVCLDCDHGRRYCSRACAQDARRAQNRVAAREYQRTERGRLLHAARQARYRDRCRARVTHQSGVLTDASGGEPPSGPVDQPPTDGVSTAPTTARAGEANQPLESASAQQNRPSCAFCGREAAFLRQWSRGHKRSRPHRRRPSRERGRHGRMAGPLDR